MKGPTRGERLAADIIAAGARSDDGETADASAGGPSEPPNAEELLPDEDGADLLDDVAAFIRRFVACSVEAVDVLALWAAHTHAIDAFDVSPRLLAQSTEPGSGKTRTLEVLKVLVRAPLLMANVSEAYLFRKVDAERCTVLHDEIDAVFGPKARDREDLRGLLNAGWERGAVVGRIVGEGSKMAPRDFQVFGAVAMAGLGRLPETIEQRALKIRLKRRKPDEPVAKFRRREVGPEAELLRNRLASWCAKRIETLERARPSLPEELGDRAQDAAEPLVAIADAAGGTWPARARAAVVAIHAAAEPDDATLGVRLLGDVLAVFDDPATAKASDPDKGEGIASGALADALAAIEGAPWPEWGKHRSTITANALARLLRGYGVRPGQHFIGGANLRGYLRSDFADAWQRYLPGECVSASNVLGPKPSAGAAPNTFAPLTHSPGGTEAELLGALDPDADDHGRQVAEVRAGFARARIAAR